MSHHTAGLLSLLPNLPQVSCLPAEPEVHEERNSGTCGPAQPADTLPSLGSQCGFPSQILVRARLLLAVSQGTDDC